jgi:hypothetical protein
MKMSIFTALAKARLDTESMKMLEVVGGQTYDQSVV